MTWKALRLTCALGLILPCLASLHAQVSGTLTPLPNHTPGSFASAENRWQLSAVNLETETDRVEPSVRAARNAYWFQQLKPVRDAEAAGLTTGEGRGMYSVLSPEIPISPDDVWVIASFDRFTVHPVPSDPSILYTEMSFTMSQVVHQPKAGVLTNGGSFQVDLAGGRAKYPDGSVRTWRVSPMQYFVQPGHTYLMDITSAPQGDLYYIHKYWDVTSGKVSVDRPDENYRAQHHEAHLNGLSIPEAVAYVQGVLSKEETK